MSRLRQTSLFTRAIAILLFVLSLGATVQASQGFISQIGDPGASYEASLGNQSQPLFGFGHPVDQSANTPSNTEPGPQAVTVAQGLNVSLVSSSVGENADMIALWPNDANPEYAIICNEIN